MNSDKLKNGDQNLSVKDKLLQTFLLEPKNRDQLADQLRNAQKRGLLDSDALSMIEGVLEVAEMQVRDIMIPRTQMVVVEYDVAPEEFLLLIIEFVYLRFPVIGDNRDEVVGILLAKDLLMYFANKDKETFKIRDALRHAIFIPESKRLNVLLKEFRENRNHMAIVVDEYGGIAGLVTIEDVLEQIVGEIEDEHDIDDNLYIVKHRENRYTIKAITPIEEFNEQFSSHFSTEEFDTIGGLLTHEFGRMPKRGEIMNLEKFRFKILRADGRRVYLMQMSIHEDQQDDSNTRSVDVA